MTRLAITVAKIAIVASPLAGIVFAVGELRSPHADRGLK